MTLQIGCGIMNIKIRKTDLSDIPFIYNEETKIFGKSLGEKTLYNEVLYNKLSRYFTALVDGVRVGYIGSWLTVPNAEILNLLVINQFQGNGIGRRLIEKVIKVSGEELIEMLTLEVRVSNKKAISLYLSLGFYEGTIRKKYYGNGEDAVLMVKDIGGK